MKKRKEVIYDDTRFVFTYRDGTPIPAEKLFTQYSDPVMIIITGSFTFVQLGALSKSGKIAKEWIERKEIWRMIFKRDYPEAYLHATGSPDSSIMNFETKERLNMVSLTPYNPYTYWKRYYELMMNPIPRYPKQSDYENAYSGMNYSKTSQSRYFLQLNSRFLHRQKKIEKIFAPLEGDFDTILYTRQHEKNIRVYQNYRRLNIEIIEDIPSDTRITASHWKSIDGFVSCVFDKKKNYLFISVASESKLLVSSQCMVCERTSPQLYTCSNCKNVRYCGQDCQLADWETHKCQ